MSSPVDSTNKEVRLLSLNIKHLASKRAELEEILWEQRIDICIIYETWQREFDKFKVDGYISIMYNRRENDGVATRGHGGIGFLIAERFSGFVREIQSDAANSNWAVIEIMGIRVAGVYAAPQLQRDDFCALLDRVWDLTLDGVIAGDFNARMGETTDDRLLNMRGRILRDKIDSTDTTLCLPGEGRWTFVGKQGSSVVDYILLRGRAREAEWQLRVRDDQMWCGSDHRALMFDSDVFDRPVEQRRRERFCVKKLIGPKNRKNRELFEAKLKQRITVANELLHSAIDSRIQSSQTAQEIVDGIDDAFTIAIREAAEATVGRATRKIRRTEWTEEMRMALRERRRAHQRWRRTDGSDTIKKRERWNVLMRAKQRHADACSQAKNDGYQRFTKKLHENNEGDALRTIRLINRSRLGRTEVGPAGSDGLILTGFYEHYARVYNDTDRPLRDVKFETRWDRFPTSEGELAGILKYAANNKAAGSDEMNAELYKAAASTIIPFLHRFFALCWRYSTTPERWSDGLLFPLYKGKGDKTEGDSFRPITLTQFNRKLFERAILLHLQSAIGRISIFQAGFQRGKSTLDQAIILNEILAIHNHRKVELVALYLDLKQAYDSISLQRLWEKLEGRAVPERTIELLKELFESCTLRVIGAQGLSEGIRPSRGLLQGSIISPLLFALYMDDFPEFLQSRMERKGHPLPKLNGKTVASLMFADDIAAFALSREAAQEALDVAQEWAEINQMTWNAKKCEFTSRKPIQLRICNETIKRVREFEYLGVMMSNKGFASKSHISKRLKKATQQAAYMRAIGMNQAGFSTATSIRVYVSFVRSCLEYGLAILDCNQARIGELEKIQNGIIARILGAKMESGKRIPTKGMLSLCGLTSIGTRKRCLEARMAGRIAEADEENLLSYARDEMMGNTGVSGAAIPRILDNPIFSRGGGRAVKRADILKEVNDERSRWAEGRVTIQRMRKSGMEPFLKIRDQLGAKMVIHWRLAWVPNKTIWCFNCASGWASRNHVIGCLGIKERLSLTDEQLDGANALDFAISKIRMKKKRIADLERARLICDILEEIRRECLHMTTGRR